MRPDNADALTSSFPMILHEQQCKYTSEVRRLVVLLLGLSGRRV